MEIVYADCGYRNEFEINLRSNERYLSSSDLNPSPLRYLCSALPT